MGKHDFHCPHCGNRIKTIKDATFTPARPPHLDRTNGNGMGRNESFAVAGMHRKVRTSLIGSFWDMIVRNVKHIPDLEQPVKRLVVRSERKVTPRRMLINELQLKTTEDDLRQLARIYVELGLSWSKATTLNNSKPKISQGRHDKAAFEFIELGFLEPEVIGGDRVTKYKLTPEGLSFLEYFLNDGIPRRFPTSLLTVVST